MHSKAPLPPHAGMQPAASENQNFHLCSAAEPQSEDREAAATLAAFLTGPGQFQ